MEGSRHHEDEWRMQQEMEMLSLYRAIVDNGPDLFSVHGKAVDAPFRFASEGFNQRLRIPPGAVIGQPLASIVDARDRGTLRSGLVDVLECDKENAGSAGVAAGGGRLVELRVSLGGRSYRASMSISIGSNGIIVVTRLYD